MAGQEPQLSYQDAAAVMRIMVGALSGTFKALSDLAPVFDETQIYGLARKSLVRMLESEGGLELAQGLLAAAFTQQIREQMGASSG